MVVMMLKDVIVSDVMQAGGAMVLRRMPSLVCTEDFPFPLKTRFFD